MSSNDSRAQVLQKISADILERFIQRDDEPGFITNSDLKEIWTEPRIKELFNDQSWTSESFLGRPVLEQIGQYFLKVLSILVYIGWDDLSNFYTEFVRHQDKDGKLDRQDEDLPAKPATLQAIGQGYNAAILARDFLRDQYKFIPIVIHEGADLDLPTDKYILPLLNEAKEIGRGSFFYIYEVTIPRGQFRNYEYEEYNSEPKVIARKSAVKDHPQREILLKEVKTIKRLRKTLGNNEHILSSVASIIRGSALDVFFLPAAFDLNDLLFGTARCKDHTKWNSKLDPNNATTTDLFIEMAGIGDALDYLHQRLRREDNGKKIICVHMDIKPDNVLVFVHPSIPCGRWKISDFGLSRIKPSESSHIGTTSGGREASYRFSNTLAERYAGSFQPPEVERAKQRKERLIGPECDVWGHGCMLCLVVAYALGKEVLVQDFEDKRSRDGSGSKSNSHEYDFFYRDGGKSINPEVVSWLEDLRRKESLNEIWLGNCIQLIKDILQIEPSSRPSASLIRNRLLDDVVSKIKHAGRGSGFSTPSTVSPADSRFSIPTNANTATATPPLPSTTPYPTDHIKRFKPAFAKIKLPSKQHPIQTAISSYDGYLIFLFERSFYVASIAQLADSWSTTPSKLRGKTAYHYLHPRASGGLTWRRMVLSGSFMILSGWDSSTEERILQAHELRTDVTGHIDQRELFSERRSNEVHVAISVKGDILIGSENTVQLRRYDKARFEEPQELAVRGRPFSAAFSPNGKWLLACSSEERSNYFYYWQVRDTSVSGHGKLRPRHSRHHSSGLVEDIIPFNMTPSFVTWDENPGELRFVQWKNDLKSVEEISLKEEFPNIRVGLITPDSNALVLVQQRSSTSGLHDRVNIVPLRFDRDGHIMGNSSDYRTTRDDKNVVKIALSHDEKPCGFALKTEPGSSKVLFIILSDMKGNLEKIECEY